MRGILLAAGLALAAAAPAAGQSLSEAEVARIDAVAVEALGKSPTPSISIAVVRDGRLAFAKVYGHRGLNPSLPADAAARYDIGSISKQFTAAVVLQLADQGALSLDDKVSMRLPGLSGAEAITLRQALNHTAGYNSYFMLDFPPVEGERPIAPMEIARRWGRAPLDFPPGSRWDYSNTGYVIAGLIAERVSGRTLADLLSRGIFAPLGMTSAASIDQRPLGPGDAKGYSRVAFEPPRPASVVGQGWTFGAGGLAMTAGDLARWDIAMIEGRLLSPGAWMAQRTPARLTDGAATDYGLGVYVDKVGGRRRIRHDGAAVGATAENRVYPDDRAALVVLTNADFGRAAHDVADAVEALLFPPEPVITVTETPRPLGAVPPADEQALTTARDLVRRLESDDLDRTRLTPELSAYLTGPVLDDYRKSLSALGQPDGFVQLRVDDIGGLKASLYRLSWSERALIGVLRLAPDGRVASFALFEP